MLVIDVILDFITAIQYGFAYIVEIFKNLWLPVNYIFVFLKDMTWNLFNPISEVEPFEFSANALALFNQVPNFSLILSILGGILCLLGIFAIFKILTT